MEELIGKVIRVKIIGKQDNYYIGEELEGKNNIYIEDEGEFWEEELKDTIQKCIVLDIKNEKYIGYILSNRKFVNEMIKIDKALFKTNEYGKIEDIYLVERLKINGKVVGLYLVDEGEIGKYYLGTKEIGTYLKKLPENNILFKENTVENVIASQIKDVVMSIDLRKKEISMQQENEKQKELIREALSIENEKQMKRIVTVELDQKVEVEKKQQEEILKTTIENKEKELKTEKDINIKQEMRTKDNVTDMKTLGQVLEKNNKLPHVDGKKFTKIGIIESDDRDKLVNENGEKAKVNTTRYAFVAIASDGSVVPMDLEQDYQEGNNPRERNIQVTRDKGIKEDDVLSRYNLGEGSIAVENGKYGEIKVYHSPRKTIGGKDIEGNKSLDRQLETRNVWSIKKEERDLAGEFEDGYRSVEEGYQEAMKHKDKDGKLDAEHLEIDDVDGEKNTKSHVHDTINYDALACKWGYFQDGKPNAEKAQQLFQEKRKANPNKETKEIVDMVTEELEEQYRKER